MKQVASLVAIILFASCTFNFNKKVKGNGVLKTESRSVGSFSKIKLSGSFDVELTQDMQQAVTIEGDENILPYIITEINDGWLKIHTKNNVSISTTTKLKVSINTEKLEAISLSGSGSIIGTNKLTGGDKLKLSISGVGSADIAVNTPEIEADISGSGSILLEGETRDLDVSISGVGSFKGSDLKAENAKVSVSGSGKAMLFAENTLDISVSGVGSVYYKGNASVKQKVSGSGTVKQLP